MGRKVSMNRRQMASRLLEDLFRRYDRRFLREDPVFFVHQYSDPRDQEIVGFLSALLAFGNVKAIHGSVFKVLERLGPKPAEFVASFDASKGQKAFAGLGHRWVRGGDIHLLLTVLQKILGRPSSLKECFLEGYDDREADVASMLDRFSRRLKSVAGDRTLSRGFRYFFPSPRDGSPCKRLNMFLRWMVRPADGIDLGLWPEIPASKLIIPLDIHVFRFARKFRLSRYKTPRWEVAKDVTEFLKTLDPEDPVKYDFAICHYGMEGGNIPLPPC
jgi:uncharacterized protein (TIGR02757 family)